MTIINKLRYNYRINLINVIYGIGSILLYVIVVLSLHSLSNTFEDIFESTWSEFDYILGLFFPE